MELKELGKLTTWNSPTSDRYNYISYPTPKIVSLSTQIAFFIASFGTRCDKNKQALWYGVRPQAALFRAPEEAQSLHEKTVRDVVHNRLFLFYYLYYCLRLKVWPQTSLLSSGRVERKLRVDPPFEKFWESCCGCLDRCIMHVGSKAIIIMGEQHFHRSLLPWNSTEKLRRIAVRKLVNR